MTACPIHHHCLLSPILWVDNNSQTMVIKLPLDPSGLCALSFIQTHALSCTIHPQAISNPSVVLWGRCFILTPSVIHTSFIHFINWPVGLLFFILFTITHPSSFQPSCSFLSITFSPSIHPSSHSIYSPNHLTYSTHITVSPEQARC